MDGALFTRDRSSWPIRVNIFSSLALFGASLGHLKVEITPSFIRVESSRMARIGITKAVLVVTWCWILGEGGLWLLGKTGSSLCHVLPDIGLVTVSQDVAIVVLLWRACPL